MALNSLIGLLHMGMVAVYSCVRAFASPSKDIKDIDIKIVEAIPLVMYHVLRFGKYEK
jgi:hypothetical protein